MKDARFWERCWDMSFRSVMKGWALHEAGLTIISGKT